MIRRKVWRAICLLVLACGPSRGADAILDFVHLSDTHVTNFEGVNPRLAGMRGQNRHTAARLKTVLDGLARGWAPAFALITGDLIDAYAFDNGPGGRVLGQIEAFTGILDRSRIPIFPALGNHDLTRYRLSTVGPELVGDQTVAADAREAWKRAVANFHEGTYYSFVREVGRTTYRFLMLDDGEAAGRNPEFAAAQIAWLRRQLAGHGDQSIVVAMHIPIDQAPYKEEIKAALAAAPNLAMALAGHRHSDALEPVNLGARSLTQVRTAALFASEQNWRRIRLREDRIEVFVTGQTDAVAATIPLNGRAFPAAAAR